MNDSLDIIWDDSIERLRLLDDCSLLDAEQAMQYGPGHVVWADGNYDQAQWCLDHFDECRGMLTDEQLRIVKRALKRVAKLERLKV